LNFIESDRIKKTVSVSPIIKGGSNFETQVLHQNSNHKISFKPSLGYGLFCSVFGLGSFILLAIGIYKYNVYKSFGFLLDHWFVVIWFLFWTIGTVFLFRSFFMPIVFDKSINRYYKGFYKDKTKNSKNNKALSSIIALQIIGEVVTDKDSSFKSFELNLVLDDSNRLNVIDHGNLKGVTADAETLSTFLNVPIWHASSNKA
jgi:hypothetical protein